eukprot:s29_g74.t1
MTDQFHPIPAITVATQKSPQHLKPGPNPLVLPRGKFSTVPAALVMAHGYYVNPVDIPLTRLAPALFEQPKLEKSCEFFFPPPGLESVRSSESTTQSTSQESNDEEVRHTERSWVFMKRMRTGAPVATKQKKYDHCSPSVLKFEGAVSLAGTFCNAMSALCYSKTFIDVAIESSAVARSQSTPPMKRLNFDDTLDLHALQFQHHDTQMNLQVSMLQHSAQMSSESGMPIAFESAGFEVAPSQGSYGHPNICRRPCILFVKGTCKAGAECNFCHLNHDVLPPSLDKRMRKFLKSLPHVHFMEMILPYVQKHVQECELPGASRVLQLLQSQIAIRSYQTQQMSPQPRPRDGRGLHGVHRRIQSVLKRFTLANLVGLLCAIMSGSRFPLLVSRELDKLRQTAQTLTLGGTK